MKMVDVRKQKIQMKENIEPNVAMHGVKTNKFYGQRPIQFDAMVVGEKPEEAQTIGVSEVIKGTVHNLERISGNTMEMDGETHRMKNLEDELVQLDDTTKM